MSFFVHETSIVDDNCQLGDNTKVWHFSHILKGSVIGENCSFGQNCVVGPNVKMGSGIKVQNNVSIYEGVEVEDDVFLGPSMVFTNVINPRSFIVRKEEFKPTILRKGCSIGANATIVCGNEIGTYALVGSGTVIVKPVKPFALVVGVPGKQIGWVSIAGNRLDFDAENKATDTADGSQYQLTNNDVIILKR